jgi:3-oxoacyl-[acyl-carrier protein] reductase
MDLAMQGKAVLITGGNRGLGAELALAFAREGVDVGICARDGGRLEQVRAAVDELGVRCCAIVADLDANGECERVVAAVARDLGRLDILVNNASTNIDGTGVIRANSAERLLRRVTGKATWAIRCTQAALPHLAASGAGRVIFVGGSALRASYPSGAAAPTTGVVAAMGSSVIATFAKYLQEEVIGDGILVNVVHPGATRTDRYDGRVRRYANEHSISVAEADQRMRDALPLKRMVETTDITPLVLLLSSPLAAAISAQAVAIDGGSSPAVMY